MALLEDGVVCFLQLIKKVPAKRGQSRKTGILLDMAGRGINEEVIYYLLSVLLGLSLSFRQLENHPLSIASIRVFPFLHDLQLQDFFVHQHGDGPEVEVAEWFGKIDKSDDQLVELAQRVRIIQPLSPVIHQFFFERLCPFPCNSL